MQIVTQTAFTPWASLGGGILIGLSAVMVMALFGRIAGIAGISQGALGGIVPLQGAARDRDWRWAFLLGLLAARVGGSPVVSSIVRVSFWGALAMALTAGVGALFGVAT